jgi:uncharacterized protein (DUF58 family)
VRDFVAALRGLTVRGRSFLAAGVACAASAVVLGEQDLLRVGMLLAGLPVLAAAFVCRTRYRLACTRRIDPPRVAAGDDVSVRIRLDNISRLASSTLLVADDAPLGPGGQARFVLDRIEPGGSRDLSYRFRAQGRGRYQVGPISLRLSDPFGMCELSRAFRSRDELVVAPPIEKLPPRRPAGPVNRPTVRHRTARAGEDETTTRPYRSGDDLRRVHWRTTARTGQLMVRREERPHTGGATLLLDTRAQAWHDEGPASPFEWAVSATGSIAVHLALSGYSVRLVCAGGLVAAGAPNTVTAVVDELAVVTTVPSTSLRPAFTAVSPGEHGMVVAVLGRTDPATAASIAGLRPRNAPAIAVLVDVASWGANVPDTELAAIRAALSRRGWAVLVAGRGSSLAKEWVRLARPAGPPRRRPGTPAGRPAPASPDGTAGLAAGIRSVGTPAAGAGGTDGHRLDLPHPVPQPGFIERVEDRWARRWEPPSWARP